MNWPWCPKAAATSAAAASAAVSDPMVVTIGQNISAISLCIANLTAIQEAAANAASAAAAAAVAQQAAHDAMQWAYGMTIDGGNFVSTPGSVSATEQPLTLDGGNF